MLLKDRIASRVTAGEIGVVFRRWAAPRVSPGSTFRTAHGVVRVNSIERIDPDILDDADARAAGEADLPALLATLRGEPDRPVFRIALEPAGADERIALAARDTLEPTERAELAARLDSLDRRRVWTRPALRLIAERPGTPAAELAAALDQEKAAFKRRVRQLKELGLTSSLEVGYELSPRGRAFLADDRGA